MKRVRIYENYNGEMMPRIQQHRSDQGQNYITVCYNLPLWRISGSELYLHLAITLFVCILAKIAGTCVMRKASTLPSRVASSTRGSHPLFSAVRHQSDWICDDGLYLC